MANRKRSTFERINLDRMNRRQRRELVQRLLVTQILQAAPPGSLVFLETPCENALGFRRILRRLAQIPLMIAVKPRLAPHLLRPATLYMMHEHINYYTERSLTTLMSNCGAAVLASGFYPLTSRASSEDVVWCLGEKSD